jgi:hypothetical protein
MAYEIWGHGRTPTTINDYGVVYRATDLEIKRNQKDISIKFKKYNGQKTKLTQQYIGTVHLEHHFEMYAYRSDDGSASIEIQSLQNNCNALISPFESYGGIVTKRGQSSGYDRWTPWKYDSLMWQVRRGVPRRVMYKGSGIPIFHFDLVNMETISLKNNLLYDGEFFEGTKFLEHYYRYFFAMIYYRPGTCEYPGDIPNAPEWNFSHLLDSYNYVIYWLEEMIKTGIIQIKDHSIDLSKEVNNLIRAGGYDDQGDIVIADEIDLEVGGTEGYRSLIDLFGVSAGTENATTPKIIKQVLLNTEGLESWRGPSSDTETFRAFLPRRAILPVGQSKAGVTAWGFTGSFAGLEGTSYGFTGSPTRVSEAISDLPLIYNINDETSIFNEVLNPQKVVCGLYGTFIIDGSGKLSLFGNDIEDRYGNYTCPDQYENWQLRVGCVPYYLRVDSLFELDENNEIKERELQNIPDGNVIDIAYRRDFAVALVDFQQGGIANECLQGEDMPTNILFTPAFENSSTYENDTDGINGNVNANNEFITSNGTKRCSLEEPFNQGFLLPPVPGGPRVNVDTRAPNAYRLKSWGSLSKKYGTFSGSNIQGSINSPCGDQVEPISYLRSNTEINPIVDGGFSRRYPGTNNSFIWTAVSSGIKHLAAIDDYGGLFITPQSDNTYNQSQKGLGVTYASIYKQASDIGDFSVNQCIGHNGLGNKFNYFPHIPRPGYIKENEWNQAFYNNITLNPSNYAPYGTYKQLLCHCAVGISCPPSDPFGNVCAGPLYPLDASSPTGCCGEPFDATVKDLTCILFGSLVDHGALDSLGNEILLPENDTQPRYTKIACGLYNTLCLTNENRLEIYGSYIRVKTDGEPLIDDQNPGITAFVPQSLLLKAGTWGVTYACPVYCQGATHSPILGYRYDPPSPSNIITEIYSSGDYSICVTADNKVHIWGESSMVPGAFDPNTYRPGNKDYKVLSFENITEIVSVAAGVNSIYIHYKKNLVTNTDTGFPYKASVTYEYTRYNINGIETEVPDDVENSRIIDMDAGFLHAVAIYSKKFSAKTWKAEDFATDTLKYQFKNFSSLPFYLRRQAFFHALPGGWDYSKWLFGGVCCSQLEGANNPVAQPDPCSALRYNIYENNLDDIQLAYSGNPHLYWMRIDWRRNTNQSLDNLKGVGKFADLEDACRPDLGLDLESGGSNFSFMSSAVGTCLNEYGPAWATGRPTISKVRNDRKWPIVGPNGSNCWQVPCTPDASYTNPRVNPPIALTAIGVDTPPRIGYRATKDLFQKMTIFYGNRGKSVGNNNTLQTCGVAAGAAWSYFKYSERHYYLGYDENKDTWEIYENPDFLRETSEAYFKGLRPGEERQFYGGCTLFGFGGGTGPNGGNCAGCSGYYGLFDYPLTGPNYGIENVMETPVVITAIDAQVTINNALIERTESPNGPFCDGCFADLTRDQVIRQLGPGGFQLAGPQVALETTFEMVYKHYYNRTIRRTQKAKQLLLGTSTNLSATTIPPNSPGTDYEKKSFIEVLGDSQYTEKYNPWLYSSSSKWIPICWRTPFVIPNATSTNTLSSKELYFNYSVSQGSGRLQLSPQKTSDARTEQIYPLSTLPVIFEAVDPQDTIRFVDEFITDINYPDLIELPKGVFEFFIWCKTKYSDETVYMLFEIYKIDENFNQTLIARTLADTPIEPAVNNTVDPSGSVEGIDEIKQLITHAYLPETVSLNVTDRLLIKMLVKGGNAAEDEDIGDSITILYEDDTNATVGQPPTATNVSKYTRMQYTHVTDDINQTCFVGFNPEDNVIIPDTQVDPNIVKIMSTAPLTIAGPPVRCIDTGCCD